MPSTFQHEKNTRISSQTKKKNPYWQKQHKSERHFKLTETAIHNWWNPSHFPCLNLPSVNGANILATPDKFAGSNRGFSPGPEIQFLCWSPSSKSLEDRTSGLSDRPILDAATLSWDVYIRLHQTRSFRNCHIVVSMEAKCLVSSAAQDKIVCNGQFAMTKGEESCL